jgi:hypothetical protein
VPEQQKPTGSKPSQATLLVQLARDLELFHTCDCSTFATMVVNGHKETWALRTRGFRSWLARRFYERHAKAPHSQAVLSALNVLEGRALYEGLEIPVHVRVAGAADSIHVDLGNLAWEAVEVTASGWRVVRDPPVRFRRTAGMAALPCPVLGGSLDLLRPFVNVASDGDWTLFLAWLVQALRPHGPYPVLAIYGEQGSAKSTASRVARALVDPGTLLLRSAPKDVRDLMVAAKGNWCLVYDNLSRLPAWFSDAMCRLATGGGFGTRQLYTDEDEVLFTAQRPVIINGIEELATRSDLLDRAIPLTLPVIQEADRRTEREFWEAFEGIRPQVLGALLTAVTTAMRNEPTVALAGHPRMADFAEWGVAAEAALGARAGGFLDAYAANRAEAHDLTLDVSPLAPAVRTLVARGEWESTASELLRELGLLTDDEIRKQRGWPKGPSALSGQLRRLAPNFRAAGIEITWRREPGGDRRRLIRIRKPSRSVVPSVPLVPEPALGDGVRDGAEGTVVPLRPGENGLDGGDGTTRDGGDGDSRHLSPPVPPKAPGYYDMEPEELREP